MVTYYRRKPIKVETMEFTLHSLEEVKEWLDENGCRYSVYSTYLEIFDGPKTYNSDRICKVRLGDTIVKYNTNHFTCYDDTEFEELFEEIEDEEE